MALGKRESEGGVKKIWFCKIGAAEDSSLPMGADFPMRLAVAKAYKELTGETADFLFSGWGGELTEHELAIVEDRASVIAPHVEQETTQVLEAE